MVRVGLERGHGAPRSEGGCWLNRDDQQPPSKCRADHNDRSTVAARIPEVARLMKMDFENLLEADIVFVVKPSFGKMFLKRQIEVEFVHGPVALE
jgi:hypothetical protein